MPDTPRDCLISFAVPLEIEVVVEFTHLHERNSNA